MSHLAYQISFKHLSFHLIKFSHILFEFNVSVLTLNLNKIHYQNRKQKSVNNINQEKKRNGSDAIFFYNKRWEELNKLIELFDNSSLFRVNICKCIMMKK